MRTAVRETCIFTKTVPQYIGEGIVATFSYDGTKQSLYKLEFSKSVEFVSVFGSNSPCDPILRELYYLYETLLLKDITAVYLVNRNEQCICLLNTSLNTSMNQNNATSHNFLIIKLDAVLASYYSNKFSVSKYSLLASFTLGVLSTFAYLSYFYKN